MIRGTDSIYNSKELVVDPELTFLSYNQTINAEFTLEEILGSPLWSINSDNGLIKAIPLFNCDKITSSNESDKVLDSNKCVILENNVDTIVKCISDDTGSMHYHSVELYAYAPYTKLDVIDEVTVYCILHDEYLNTVGNVNVDVYLDDELSKSVLSDSNGVCKFNVDQPCTVKFVYGELESNDVVVGGSQVYTLSIETDKQSLFTDESVTVTGVLTMDGDVYADQSIGLYDGSSLIDTLTTDSNGEYSKTVSGLSVGTHVFRAVHAHVRSGTVSVTVSEPAPVHDYSLSVVSDKDIISYADGESATLTATLKDNDVVVSGETLSYTVKHGATTIDSGTGTTDSNGEISFNYTATGVGDVTVEIDYSSLLQETYELVDYWAYDTLTVDKQKYSITSGSATMTYSNDGLYIKGTVSSDTSINSTITVPVEYTAELDCDFNGNANYSTSIIFDDLNTVHTGSKLEVYYESTNTKIKTINVNVSKTGTLKVKRTGTSMEIYWNDTLLDTITGISSTGATGFRTYNNRQATFKNLRIKAL